MVFLHIFFEEKPTFINALKCTIESSQREELRDLITDTKNITKKAYEIREDIGADEVFIFNSGVVYTKNVDGKLQIIRKEGNVTVEDICKSIALLEQINKRDEDNQQNKTYTNNLTQLLDQMIEEENPKLKAIREKKEALQQEYDDLKAQMDEKKEKGLTRKRK